MAVRAASSDLRSPTLDGCIVYASGHPCPMCFAAMALAGGRRFSMHAPMRTASPTVSRPRRSTESRCSRHKPRALRAARHYRKCGSSIGWDRIPTYHLPFLAASCLTARRAGDWLH
jgi:tRNA(Arg) A34 adenosine deaminase TadA